MQTSDSYTNEMTFPSQQEIALQVSKARRARSDHLHESVVNGLAALVRRFNHTSPATN